jgi:hypothetical protein
VRSADGQFVRVSEPAYTNRHRRVAKMQLEPRAYRTTTRVAHRL